MRGKGMEGLLYKLFQIALGRLEVGWDKWYRLQGRKSTPEHQWACDLATGWPGKQKHRRDTLSPASLWNGKSKLGRCAEFEPHGPCWDDDRTLPTAVPGVRSSVRNIPRVGRSDHSTWAFSPLRGNRPAVWYLLNISGVPSGGPIPLKAQVPAQRNCKGVENKAGQVWAATLAIKSTWTCIVWALCVGEEFAFRMTCFIIFSLLGTSSILSVRENPGCSGEDKVFPGVRKEPGNKWG